MPAPLIAIVGNADQTADPTQARKAAEQLGTELARRGCRLLVYDSDPQFIESCVVHGYIKGKIEPQSIEVHHPPSSRGLFPDEKPGDKRFKRIAQGPDWEVSFYPSLAAADGIVVIGGGYPTKIAA